MRLARARAWPMAEGGPRRRVYPVAEHAGSRSIPPRARRGASRSPTRRRARREPEKRRRADISGGASVETDSDALVARSFRRFDGFQDNDGRSDACDAEGGGEARTFSSLDARGA